MSSLGQTPDPWYPLTAAPLIDLDALPGPLGVDAVLPACCACPREQIELRASMTRPPYGGGSPVRIPMGTASSICRAVDWPWAQAAAAVMAG